jgi:hypothetical protein
VNNFSGERYETDQRDPIVSSFKVFRLEPNIIHECIGRGKRDVLWTGQLQITPI